LSEVVGPEIFDGFLLNADHCSRNSCLRWLSKIADSQADLFNFHILCCRNTFQLFRAYFDRALRK
jgi:hypothetical protein